MTTRKILTENPYEEVWAHLGYFENQYNCETHLKCNGIQNLYFRKKRASLLRYYIKQANEYYNASLNVSLLTQPTLLYYGAICLSKALILGKRGYPDDTKSHGLLDEKNSKITNLSDFKIKVTRKGTFSELYKTMYSKYESNYNDIKNTIWTLNDLFSLVPELKETYEDIYNKKSHVLQVNRILDDDGEYIQINEPLFSKMKDEEINEFLSNITA